MEGGIARFSLSFFDASIHSITIFFTTHNRQLSTNYVRLITCKAVTSLLILYEDDKFLQ